MTLVQAKNVASAIIDAGYDARLHLTNGVWTVRAISADLIIPVADANALAIAQGVLAKIAEVEFS